MKNLILFDGDARNHLLPLTYTRPVADLRVGILTIREKWERTLGAKASYITEAYLSAKFPIEIEDDNYLVNGAVLPNAPLSHQVANLANNQALLFEGELIAARLSRKHIDKLIEDQDLNTMQGIDLINASFSQIKHPWDIFQLNDQELRLDFELLTRGRTSQSISNSNQVINPQHVFLEEGAIVECSILNASKGPIYVGKNAEIMEGCIVRGALALCEGATLKMGAKIYGATTVGPSSKVGGEVNNAVIMGYSNKGHDGFLGNSVLGEWCNLGADTNTSNLKNDYSDVKLWSYVKERFVPTGLQFCGLIMGDHSKCGINTMFNTGTVVGVYANIFGEGYPRNFIPSFSWGGNSGFITYKMDKALQTAERVLDRRKIKLSEADKAIVQYLYEYTATYRTWEKSSNTTT
jgi:UDP-N-acetylglucosamine diphosphorylase/glucosamine-1-phosphate N-acetyltransferase